MNNEKIKDNLYTLYDCYAQYKLLFDFYQSFKKLKNFEEIRERIDYLKKNPQVKQKTEIESLMWVIGDIK